MTRRIIVAVGFLLSACLGSTACNNGSSTPVTPSSPATNTIPYSGTIPAPVGGVSAIVSVPFTVGQTGGTVTAVLTAATETFANGTLNPAVAMLMGLGTTSGASCVLPSGSSPLPLSAGPSSGITAVLNPGAYCLQLSSGDVSPIAGPVAYSA